MECRQCGHEVSQEKGRCLYCGRPVDDTQGDPVRELSADVDAPGRNPRLEEAEAYLAQQMSLMRDRRKNPVSKVILTILFFLSMIAGGLIVWWLA